MSFTWLLISRPLDFVRLSPLGRWEVAEYFGEIVVISGVLAEYVGEFHIFQKKNEEEKRRKVTRLASLVLLFGLAIELTGLVRTSQLSGTIISALNTEAGNAHRSAENAADAASRANSSAQQAEQHAIKADEKADRFRLQIAQANARASEADARAAQARVDLARFRAPRTLTLEQRKRIIAKCKMFSGTPFDLALDPDPESIHLLGVIEDLLISCGWIEQALPKNGPFGFAIPTPKGHQARVGEYASGIIIEFSPESTSCFKNAAVGVAKALDAEGIKAIAATNPKVINPSAIHVLIGKKP